MMKYAKYAETTLKISSIQKDYNNQMYFYNNIKSHIDNPKQFEEKINDIVNNHNILVEQAMQYSFYTNEVKLLPKFIFEIEELTSTKDINNKEQSDIYEKYI